MLLSLAAPGAVLLAVGLLLGPEYAVLLALVSVVVLLSAAAAAKLFLLGSLPAVQQGTIGFFHPFANGGGGGERVLWCAVAALQKAVPGAKVVIYTGDDLTAQQLVEGAAATFNLVVGSNVQVVHLTQRSLLLPERYPRFTLIGQAVGSVRLAYEALKHIVPEVFIDTTGVAFTYPLARLAGARVAAYTHYPTVSADMLQRVRERRAGFNHDPRLAASMAASLAKLAYYYVFAAVYGAAGAFANVAMANSSWTAGHVAQLWWRRRPPVRVAPPCDTAALRSLALDRKLKRLYLVSVAQFRPEKDHALQLQAYAAARRRAAEAPSPHGEAVLASRLVLVGSCRNAADRERLAGLQAQAEALGIGACTDWVVNAPFAELRQLLAGAVGGLHTMRDEHFGISIVEYMAAGVVPIAHDSGGPRADIVVPEEGPAGQQVPTGYLCSTVDQYADAITEVLSMDQLTRLAIAAAARRRASQFSDEHFQAAFLRVLQPLLPRQWRGLPLPQPPVYTNGAA